MEFKKGDTVRVMSEANDMQRHNGEVGVVIHIATTAMGTRYYVVRLNDTTLYRLATCEVGKP